MAHFNDSGRIPDQLDQYTEDCVFEFPPNPPVAGREELKAFLERYAPAKPCGKHLILNTVIFLDEHGESAKAVSDFVFLRVPELLVQSTGRYHDTLRRDVGRWRVQIHRLKLEAALPGVDTAAAFKAQQ